MERTEERIQAGGGAGGGGGMSRTRGQGRKDAAQQPETKRPAVIVKRIGELVRLRQRAKEAAEASAEAIVKAAEDSGYLASAVRKLVIAKAGEKFEEEHRKVEQQMELFGEFGTVD